MTQHATSVTPIISQTSVTKPSGYADKIELYRVLLLIFTLARLRRLRAWRLKKYIQSLTIHSNCERASLSKRTEGKSTEQLAEIAKNQGGYVLQWK